MKDWSLSMSTFGSFFLRMIQKILKDLEDFSPGSYHRESVRRTCCIIIKMSFQRRFYFYLFLTYYKNISIKDNLTFNFA